MAGSSDRTLRIAYVNASWNAGAQAASAFELLIVTEDGERHTLPITADELSALGPLLRREGVLLVDPSGRPSSREIWSVSGFNMTGAVVTTA